MQTEAITFRLSKELKQAAEEAAMADQRSVASLTKVALISYLETKGRLVPHRNGNGA